MQADAIDIANKSAKKIPNLGMFCPQPGNVSFPPWEHRVPLMGNLSAVFEAAATNELTHDAGGWNLLIADGDKVMQEL